MTKITDKLPFILITILLVGIYGCKTSEQTTSESDDAPQEIAETPSERQAMLDRTRSQLTDLYVSQKQDIPEAFLKDDSETQQTNRNPYDGYRVQILSTRDVALADSVSNEFRSWADSTISGYQPKVYQSFRQPHYRVHIGDFQQRDKANEFSRLIKFQYPDAWVVHDRIEPEKVPTDTASFSLQEPDSLSADSLNMDSD